MRNSVRNLVGLGLMALAAVSWGQTVDLVNGGSFATINAGSSGTPGLVDWHIGNGPSNVVQQVYLFRVGNGPVNVVNSIGAPNVDQPTTDLATITYTSGAQFFDLSFRYLLTGAGGHNSDLAEIATLVNRGQTNLSFSLYEYDFFSPGGVQGGTGTLLNSSTIRQSNAAGMVTVGATNIPDAWMIDTSGNVATAILNGSLTNGSSPFTNNDLAFAFQWNVNLAPGDYWQMSKDKMLQPVPEPASLLVLGGLALATLRKRRRS